MDPTTLLLVAVAGFAAWTFAKSQTAAATNPAAKPPGAGAIGAQPAKAVQGNPIDDPLGRLITRPWFQDGSLVVPPTGDPTRDAVVASAVKEAPSILGGLGKSLMNAFQSIPPSPSQDPPAQTAFMADAKQYQDYAAGGHAYYDAMEAYFAASGGQSYAASQDLGIDQAGGWNNGVSSQNAGWGASDAAEADAYYLAWGDLGIVPADRPYPMEGSIGMDNGPQSIESSSYWDLGIDNMPADNNSGAGAATSFGDSPGGSYYGADQSMAVNDSYEDYSDPFAWDAGEGGSW